MTDTSLICLRVCSYMRWDLWISNLCNLPVISDACFTRNVLIDWWLSIGVRRRYHQFKERFEMIGPPEQSSSKTIRVHIRKFHLAMQRSASYFERVCAWGFRTGEQKGRGAYISTKVELYRGRSTFLPSTDATDFPFTLTLFISPLTQIDGGGQVNNDDLLSAKAACYRYD